MGNKNAIVIGAGIVGLAAARALAMRGYKVDVFEKSERAVGASVRNFGMVWPIGQPMGHMYERAQRSKNVWREVCEDANIWHSKKGSIHVAYEQDELNTIEEFVDINAEYRDIRLLNKEDLLSLSPAVNPNGLLGGFFSADEIIVDPREAIRAIPDYFAETLNINFRFLSAVTRVEHPYVWCGAQKYQADEIYICSGQEFESLYPELYISSPLTKCSLQMLRTMPQPGFHIGPAICGGLTLLHYKSFTECPSLVGLSNRIRRQMPDYIEHGIHVMISQNALGEITIGDSHEYGFTHDPFNRADINELIMNYLKHFVVMPDWTIQQTWNGIYVKMVEGTELVLQPEEGVTIVNGLGGAGMTLSFGLLEEIVTGSYKIKAAAII